MPRLVPQWVRHVSLNDSIVELGQQALEARQAAKIAAAERDRLLDEVAWLRSLVEGDLSGQLHVPRRGSDVETYLHTHRDLYPSDDPRFDAFDMLLDDYRVRADEGRTLLEVRD